MNDTAFTIYKAAVRARGRGRGRGRVRVIVKVGVRVRVRMSETASTISKAGVAAEDETAAPRELRSHPLSRALYVRNCDRKVAGNLPPPPSPAAPPAHATLSTLLISAPP